jgi:hypothetical protein
LAISSNEGMRSRESSKFASNSPNFATQRGGQKTTRQLMRNIITSTLQVAACCHIKVPLQNIIVPGCALA